MKTIVEYVAEVGENLPRWYPGRRRVLDDLHAHLADRVAAGEVEAEVVRRMETPLAYASALADALELKPASIPRRAGAFMIDLAIGLPVGMLPFVAFFLIASEGRSDIWGTYAFLWEASGSFSILVKIWLIICLPLMSLPILSLVYFPVVEATFGTTLGKHLLGLGVVVQDGTRVDWAKAYLRRIPFFFQFYPIDSAFVLFSRKRQRAFDRVAGTLVVSYPAGAV